MDTTVTTAAREAVQHGISGWLVLLILTCFLGGVYFFVFHPIITGHGKRAKHARELAHIVNAFPRSEKKRVRTSYPDTVEPDLRLIAELRTILDRSKPHKEIRPADVRQHLSAKGLCVSEARILRAMDDLTDIYYFVGRRSTSKGQLIIWRIPEQPADTLPAYAHFYEDVK